MALIMIQVAGPELELMMEGKTDDDTERQLVHTLQCSRHCFHCIDLLSLGGIYLPPFFSNGPANQSQAGPSCDGGPAQLMILYYHGPSLNLVLLELTRMV